VRNNATLAGFAAEAGSEKKSRLSGGWVLRGGVPAGRADRSCTTRGAWRPRKKRARPGRERRSGREGGPRVDRPWGRRGTGEGPSSKAARTPRGGKTLSGGGARLRGHGGRGGARGRGSWRVAGFSGRPGGVRSETAPSLGLSGAAGRAEKKPGWGAGAGRDGCRALERGRAAGGRVGLRPYGGECRKGRGRPEPPPTPTHGRKPGMGLRRGSARATPA